ncbi:MAG TPA: winged helix DNA-binding protein [Allosphingosinicella sp.]
MTEDREAHVPEQRSLLAISRVLEETARMLHDWALAEDPPLRRPTDKPMPVTASLVRTLFAARWLRRDFLGFDAGDPEWSLMLELYAARLEGRQVHQAGLSVAAGVPQSTALQATRRLVEAGLFTTKPDPRDGRKLLVALTAPATARIHSYLTAALEIGSPVA